MFLGFCKIIISVFSMLKSSECQRQKEWWQWKAQEFQICVHQNCFS